MPDPQTVTVCRLVAADWQAYRAIRLAMLEDAPLAFGSTHAEAATFDEALWRQRLADNVVIVALVGTMPAGSVIYSDYGLTEPGDCALYGMWVDSGLRGAGIGRALVDAVIEQARAAGKSRIVLHVVAGNDAARRLYERAGFVPTGRTLPYPHEEGVVEVEMELRLHDGS